MKCCERCGNLEGKQKPEWLFYIYHPQTMLSETPTTVTFMKGSSDLLCGKCCDFLQGKKREREE